MSLIKILPENLVNQIAAGEVVERPASVVKELVENSIDAGAENIIVELKNGGETFIKVIDNGSGMSKEDCELALQRHATSKISEEADLWKINTMGFRGEAIASIASVSRLTIKSKRESDMAGTELYCEGGEILTIKETGMSTGSRMEVSNLFFNTPVRQKYLKKESTELAQVSSLLNSIALAHPEVSLKLIHNGKTIFDLPRVTDLISRISDIFGIATAEAMIPVFFGGSAFQIDGFIGKPAISRSSTKHQYFFVNGRPIQHYLLANTIKSAFHSLLMENKKPVFLLNIKIDPALIDVNVHPRKVEIRFEDQQTLIKAVYGCVKTALEKNVLMPKGFTESRSYMSDSFPKIESGGYGSGYGSGAFQMPKRRGDVQDAMDFSQNIMAERETQSIKEKPSMQSISQVANSYIVAQNEDGLVLVDQHAAHERVRYEQLMNQLEAQEKAVQPLLTPLQIEFTSSEVMLVEDNLEVFEKLGFEIEPFGGNTFIINGVPSFLAGEDVDQVVRGVLDDISNEKAPSKLQGRIEEIVNYMACRSAIKFGQRLNLPEMQALIQQMDELKRPYTCPHGRPTMVSLSLSELEKMFGRK